MKTKKYIALFFLVSLAIISCKKDAPVTQPDFGYNYFPTDVKRYIIYDIDSLVHNDFTHKVDTFKFQLKEYIESSFQDNSGRNTLRIERYKKNYSQTIPYSSLPWTFVNVWYANRTATTAERVEDNQRYVKLVFPVLQKKTWDANAFNTFGEQKCKYTDVNTLRVINNISSDSTLFVTQANDSNILEKKYYIEIYAKNIGMLYREIIDVQSNDTAKINKGIPLMNRITSGVEFKMTINSFGFN